MDTSQRLDAILQLLALSPDEKDEIRQLVNAMDERTRYGFLTKLQEQSTNVYQLQELLKALR